MRIGYGFDVHKFSGDGPIVICGVQIPYKHGIMAYSDGDVALHALTDAMLGAAALGDIGELFPDTDLNFKHADSRNLLRKAYSQVLEKGYCINNLDITIITQEPKISPYIINMRKNIADDLGCYVNDINIKSTTTEKMGSIGRQEGIACAAVVLLVRDNSNDDDSSSVAAW